MRMLQVNGLHVDFDTHQGKLEAIRELSFELEEGECVGLVGESGCGKSVTALSLLNLLPPTAKISGDIRWLGESVSGWDHRRWRNFRGAEAAMIFQEPGRSFDPLATVEANFREVILAHRPETPRHRIRDIALEHLHAVRIPEPERRLRNYPHQFSGGMLQRLMIALALVHRPKLLLADEPTTALDVTIQNQIIQLLKDLQRDYRLAIVFITHNLALLNGFARRVLVLYNGLLVEEGSTQEILTRPRHPYTRLLLSSLIRKGERHEERPLPPTQGQPPDPLHPLPGCPFHPRCPLREPVCDRELPAWADRVRCHVVRRRDNA